ncbi:MAG: hypothetical protein AAF447_19880, partial [Myxococcota bacterium]
MGSSPAGSAHSRDVTTAPPALPEVHDEAGDTPLWLPALGAALLAAVGLFLIFRAAFADAAELSDTAAEIDTAA